MSFLPETSLSLGGVELPEYCAFVLVFLSPVGCRDVLKWLHVACAAQQDDRRMEMLLVGRILGLRIE